MMKNPLILISYFLSSYCMAQQPVATVFPLKWTTEIGVTTYRTNILFHQGKIYIGSNGKSRESHDDPQDGVYAIDPKTGKVTDHFKLPFAGDNDVTGIAISDNRLFFGTDNYYFFCFDLLTKKELWKHSLPYDVESVPVISDFNADGKKDVAFVVQEKGFYALDGSTGKEIWKTDMPNAYSGNVSSGLADCNNDGVQDIINASWGIPVRTQDNQSDSLSNGNYHVAISGNDGLMIWAIRGETGIHNSPFLFERNGQKRIVLQDCYGKLITATLDGGVVSDTNFDLQYFFSSPLVTKDGHLIMGNHSVSFDPDYNSFANEAADKAMEVEGSVSATSVVADVLGKDSPQVLGQSETGELFIMKTDGTAIMLLKLPVGGEATLFVNDIDGDGKLEILIAGLDGKLRCYDTKSSGKVEIGGFREMNGQSLR